MVVIVAALPKLSWREIGISLNELHWVRPTFALFDVPERAFLKPSDAKEERPRRLAYFYSIFLSEGRHDAVHPQVLDQLAIVVGDVPD